VLLNPSKPSPCNPTGPDAVAPLQQPRARYILRNTWTLIKATVNGYIDDNALSRGAAIAYYTVFSLAPILVIVVAIAGLVFGETAAQGALARQIEGLMGHDAAIAVQGMVRSAWQSRSGTLATIIGLVTLLITASGVFGEMQSALNAIWRTEPQGTTVGRLVRARALSLGLVAALGFLMMVSLVVSAAITVVQTYIGGILPEAAFLISLLNFAISFVLITLLFAAIYKILPDKQLHWRDVGIGAVVTALLFEVGKTAIGLYIGSTAVASSFGAAGALAIVLLWVYYSSQIFLLGAEFTRAYAERRGAPATISPAPR
jgi:membrane protein